MFPEGFIVEKRIGCKVEAASKKRVLEQLGQILAESEPELSQDSVFDALLQRERLGSTGMGRGIALPHARMPEVTKAVAAFVQLPEAVDFDAIDGKPVDLAFAMLVPEEATEAHLQLLAILARMFSNHDFCTALRQAETSRQILDLIQKQAADIEP